MNNSSAKIIALFLLISSFFLWPILFLVVKLTSSGSFIFRQKRMGKNEEPFTFYKIRTMVKNAQDIKFRYKHLNEVEEPVFKIKNDPRHTSVGRFLSHTGLDELPQLVNVLRGEMSLVGPRPLPVAEAKRIPKQYGKRFSVLPGMTSSWVIKGSHKLGFKKWMELDLQDVKSKSFKHDLQIIVFTVLLMLGKIVKKKIIA